MSDQPSKEVPRAALLQMAADVVSAYISNNALPTGSLPGLIRTVHESLAGLRGGDGAADAPLNPAVPIRKSIKPDYIVCLEDGRKLKMLKRHLRTVYNLSPDEYRAKWGLDRDYPMVAPNYSKRRSEFAKQIGLGRRR